MSGDLACCPHDASRRHTSTEPGGHGGGDPRRGPRAPGQARRRRPCRCAPWLATWAWPPRPSTATSTNRDDLLTLLIVSAYTSLAETVEAAHAAVQPEDLDGRWRAIGTALREWARAHPHEFALVYGSPVPDYAGTRQSRTNEPGTRVQALLVALLADARRRRTPHRAPPSAFAPQLGAARAAGGRTAARRRVLRRAGLDPGDAHGQGCAAWTLLLGTVTSELFEQLGDTVDGHRRATSTTWLEVAGRPGPRPRRPT